MSGNNVLKWLGIAAYILCGALVVVFVLPLFGWKALEVMTPSMKPAISPGDLVIVHRVPLKSIQSGNIVTYANLHQPGTTITHRVTAVKTIEGVPSYIVKGDANSSPDAPVAAGQIVGRVALVVPGAGKLASLLHNPIGLLALVIIPAVYVIWSEIKTLRRLWKQPARIRPRRLDGVYRITLMLLAIGLVISVGGVTFAQLTSSASLTANMFSVSAGTSTPTPTPTPTTSPSPTPCNVTITNTGPGSTNIVHCSQRSITSSSSSTSVSVTNQSTQTATSGGITIENNTSSGSGTPGSVSNSSSSVTNISITK
jgi:signal peptidase I